MLISQCGKQKLAFFQNNSKKVNLNADKITEQILEWLETGAISWVGPAAEVESPIRAGLVLATNTKITPEGEKIKFRVCMDGGPWTITKTHNPPCLLNTITDVLLFIKPGQLMSKWDDKSGFHHLKMDVVSRDYTHFMWGDQIFRYNAAAFGIGRVPAD